MKKDSPFGKKGCCLIYIPSFTRNGVIISFRLLIAPLGDDSVSDYRLDDAMSPSEVDIRLKMAQLQQQYREQKRVLENLGKSNRQPPLKRR